jgi:hypothetical protein
MTVRTMAVETNKSGWMLRITIIRHNLHSAIRTKDFTFFKALQAESFIQAIDHAAVLHSLVDNEADSDLIVQSVDDLNTGLAYVHQDSVKFLYSGIRAGIGRDNNESIDFKSPEKTNHNGRLALLRVDISQQKEIADFAIDKIISSAISLIDAQPSAEIQEAVANLWITGLCIVSDAIQACVLAVEKLENALDDFIFLECTWQGVQNAVDAAVSALEGVFSLKASAAHSRSDSEADTSSHKRHSSVISGALASPLAASWMNRFSSALTGNGYEKGHMRRFSTSSVSEIRDSITLACPTSVPGRKSVHLENTLSDVSYALEKDQSLVPDRNFAGCV